MFSAKHAHGGAKRHSAGLLNCSIETTNTECLPTHFVFSLPGNGHEIQETRRPQFFLWMGPSILLEARTLYSLVSDPVCHSACVRDVT